MHCYQPPRKMLVTRGAFVAPAESEIASSQSQIFAGSDKAASSDFNLRRKSAIVLMYSQRAVLGNQIISISVNGTEQENLVVGIERANGADTIVVCLLVKVAPCWKIRCVEGRRSVLCASQGSRSQIPAQMGGLQQRLKFRGVSASSGRVTWEEVLQLAIKNKSFSKTRTSGLRSYCICVWRSRVRLCEAASRAAKTSRGPCRCQPGRSENCPDRSGRHRKRRGIFNGRD